MYLDPIKLIRDVTDAKTRVTFLEAGLAAAHADIKKLQAALEQARGGWRALAVVGVVAGSLGAIITRVFFH